MRSIIKMAPVAEIDEVVKVVKATTKARILSAVLHEGWWEITIEHSEGKTCPHCGGYIHGYGHGLCMTCWQQVKSELGGV